MNYYNRIHELVLINSLSRQGLTEEQINEFLGSLMKGIGTGLKTGLGAGIDKFKEDRAEKKARADANSLTLRAKAQREAYRKNPASVDPAEFKKLQVADREAGDARRAAFIEKRNAVLPKGAQLKQIDPSITAGMKKMSVDRFGSTWREANRNPLTKIKRRAGKNKGKSWGMNVVSSTFYGDVADMIRESLNEGKLCPEGKAAAKRKFKVYPSAYANMYASAVCSGKVTPGGEKNKK
jgi:hypothetical protein